MTLSDMTIAGLHAHLRAKIGAALAALGADAPVELAPPPNPEMGDLGFPCFPLAKLLRKAPPRIAAELAEKIAADDVLESATATGPYVNLRIRPAARAQVVLREVLAQRKRFGAGQADPPQRYMVEFSSPNTNKPLHLGHLRNNLLGASVSAILAHHGHRVTRICLINDRGVHICKSMLAYEKWGEGADPAGTQRKGDHLVGDFYVLFERRFQEEYAAWQGTEAARARLRAWQDTAAGKAAADPERDFFGQIKDEYFNSTSPLGAEVRELLRRWEAGDETVRLLWRRMNGWVLDGFEQTYARLGVGFDELQRESETYQLGKRIVDEGLAAGALARTADGAVVCDLTRVGLSGEKVLLRSDGTSVYMTQDLGTAVERFERFELDRLIYVVGDEQNYHFDVLFKVLGLLRPGLAERCEHLSYGMIRLPEGRMKSREGTVVDADDLMDEVHRLARAETELRAAEGKAHTEGIDEQELELRAEQIGMAALKYFLLKFTPRKSFEYDPHESIDFLGQTGPYCLFNYARTRSLLRKAGAEELAYDGSAAALLVSEREQEILRLLAGFPDVVARAARTLDPSRVAEHCFELCKSFAFVFTDKVNHPIVTCEDPALRHARLLLAAAVGHTLRAGLGLLGIEVLEEM